MSQVAGHAHRLVSDALAQYGVRKHHFTVLLALAEHGPGSQARLGRSLCLDRSDLHGVLNDLERDGLIARARDDEDRRRNVVRLTPEGRKALAHLDALVAAAQEELLEPLSDDERRKFRRILTRLVEHHRDPAS